MWGGAMSAVPGLSTGVVALQLDKLRYKHEETLFILSLLFSAAVWLVFLVGTVGIALIFVALGFIVYLFAHSSFISMLQGSATRITATQFPDLHQRIVACSQKLKMSPVPETYLLHHGGAFNALATRFLGRNFIVLYSDVVDALEAEPEALNFYIGHELGHIRRNHLLWMPFLWPASILPLLGSGYSRSREYSCDMHGAYCCATPEAAARGIAALAAGGKRWHTLDLAEYSAQSNASGGFWMSYHELISGYPWLSKRMTRMLEPGADMKFPGRHFLAWLLALITPSGGAVSILIVVYIVGVLAAIALPAYQDYVQRAKMSVAINQANSAAAAVGNYYSRSQAIPPTLEDAGVSPPASDGLVEAMSIDPKNGVITVTLGAPPFAGQEFKLVPSKGPNQTVVWTCKPGTVKPQYMPASCR